MLQADDPKQQPARIAVSFGPVFPKDAAQQRRSGIRMVKPLISVDIGPGLQRFHQ
jgi:hypothetical protein